jgi:hypothetical protein
MSDPCMDELGRWLAAERAGALDDADELFAAVASRHLPPLREPAGLAAAILAAVPRRRRSGRFTAVFGLAGSSWVRATVSAAVAVLGIALATLSLDRLLAFSTWSVERLARLTHDASAALAASIGVCGAALTLVADLGRAAMLVAGSGAAPAVIAANVLVAGLAFLGLSRLLSPREECY